VIVGWNSDPRDEDCESIYYSDDWHGYGTNALWYAVESSEDSGSHSGIESEPASYTEQSDFLLTGLATRNEEQCIAQCEEAGGTDCTQELTLPWDETLAWFNADDIRECAQIDDYRPNVIYAPNQGNVNGTYSPSWLSDEGIGDLWTAFEDWCELTSNQCDIDLFDASSIEDTSSDPITMYTGTGHVGNAINTMLNTWRKMYVLSNSYGDFGLFQFADTDYLDYRFRYLERLAETFNTFDRFDALYATGLNSESGELPNLAKAGFMDFTAIDIWARDLEDRALTLAASSSVDMPLSLWAVNISMGGRAFAELTEIAHDNGMGIATHGTTASLNYQFLQHLEHVVYVQEDLTYRATGNTPLAFVHTDLEAFHEAENTEAQFRQFRLSAVNTIALATDSLLVSSYALPSTAYGDSCRAEEDDLRFDWSAIEQYNPDGFVPWLSRNIGSEPATAPEAFCNLTTYGAELPSGVDFDEAIDAMHASVVDGVDTWGQVREVNGEMRTYGSWEEDYLRAPQVGHLGRHCSLIMDNGGGTPQRSVDAYDGEPHVAWDNWGFGRVVPYEARSTRNATASRARRALYFDLADEFAGEQAFEWVPNGMGGGDWELAYAGGAYIVKVVFAANPDERRDTGKFALEYSDGQTWQRSAVLRFDRAEMGDDIYTATFRLDDALFLSMGRYDSDLAIVSVGGASPDILTLRVVREEDPAL